MTAGGPLLAVECSTDFGSVAVGAADGTPLAEVAFTGRASSRLLPAADEALRGAGLRAADLAGVVVGAGPGSFTGIRIAGATAKGIVRAVDVPMFAYSSLLATAANGWAAGGVVWALADARGRDVYAAAYRFGDSIETVEAPVAISLDGLVERVTVSGTASLFVGEGAIRHREELIERVGASVSAREVAMPRAAMLLWLVARDPDGGRVERPAEWEPEYLRASGAERIAAARAVTGGEG